MKKIDSNYHIVYATDNNFVNVLAISMISLFRNNREAETIQIYILDSNVELQNKEKIENICTDYQRPKPIWIKAVDIQKRLQMKILLDRGSVSQYARLFLANALPSDLKRVLYLDCDTIVMDTIEELWNLDMEGNTIAALMDAFSKFYRANIGLEKNDLMFNSGVMLIDLEKWKSNKIEEKLETFISKKRGKVQQGDQGALNAVLSKKTYCFEPRYNSVTIFYDFSYQELIRYRKPPSFYSEQEIKRAVNCPVIIHFTTSFLSLRPWMKDCKHRYVNEWLKYKELSPWAETPLLVNKKKPGIKNIYIYIIKKLPHNMMIGFSSILQVYGRPLMYRVLNYIDGKKEKGI